MVNVRPPREYCGTPVMTLLPAGTVLFRVHPVGCPAHAFNPTPSHRYYGGGRFDATADDQYPYLYAGETVDVAIAETLLRDLPFDENGTLRVPRARIDGRRISAVTTVEELSLVSLRSAADLAAVSQDPWLTTCGPQSYAQARHWGHWIRAHAPAAAGYVWMSHREPTQRAFVLFGDRMSNDAIVTADNPSVPEGHEAEFDHPQGRRALIRWLARHHVALSRR